MGADEATKRQGARVVASFKPAVALGENADVVSRVEEAWPGQLRAAVAGIVAERERCARIVEALVGGANGPETDAILTTVADAIRSAEQFSD